ncbi:MAG TPA: NAD-dependent epimerase/dehydratase family protein [Gemmatimonadaceae bacterium]
MRSLVTGGAGFIGSHVARHCLALGHEVVVLDDLSGGFQDQVPPGATFVQGSVTDAPLLARLFAEHRFDYVYHLAAYAAEGLSHFIRRFNYTNNVIGSVNLVNEAVKHEVKCFVFTSSIAVYGAGQLPMREELVPQPEDPYGIAKYAVELDLRAAHEMFGLDSIVFRPHNVYGEHQNLGDRYRNVIGIFMNQIMRGEPLTVFGDGEQTRAFSYIDDVAPAIARSVDLPAAYNEVINIGADTPYSINQLIRVVGEAFGVAPAVKHLEARNEVVHAYSTHEKAQRIFGGGPAVTLEEGIARMAAWARRAGARSSSRFEGIELVKNLPPAWRG